VRWCLVVVKEGKGGTYVSKAWKREECKFDVLSPTQGGGNSVTCTTTPQESADL
jgi:hypothetical protein